MICIDTRVLPVPHGSTSVARAASHGIQSAGSSPSQRSLYSGNPARSAFTHSATASCCMAVRGSSSLDPRSRAASRASASAASKSTNVTSATVAAPSVAALLWASATNQRSAKTGDGAAPANCCTCFVVTDPSPLRALH